MKEDINQTIFNHMNDTTEDREAITQLLKWVRDNPRETAVVFGGGAALATLAGIACFVGIPAIVTGTIVPGLTDLYTTAEIMGANGLAGTLLGVFGAIVAKYLPLEEEQVDSLVNNLCARWKETAEKEKQGMAWLIEWVKNNKVKTALILGGISALAGFIGTGILAAIVSSSGKVGMALVVEALKIGAVYGGAPAGAAGVILGGGAAIVAEYTSQQEDGMSCEQTKRRADRQDLITATTAAVTTGLFGSHHAGAVGEVSGRKDRAEVYIMVEPTSSSSSRMQNL